MVALLDGHVVPNAGFEVCAVVRFLRREIEGGRLASDVDETIIGSPEGIGADAVSGEFRRGESAGQEAAEEAERIHREFGAAAAVAFFARDGGIGALGKIVRCAGPF